MNIKNDFKYINKINIKETRIKESINNIYTKFTYISHGDYYGVFEDCIKDKNSECTIIMNDNSCTLEYKNDVHITRGSIWMYIDYEKLLYMLNSDIIGVIKKYLPNDNGTIHFFKK